MNEIMIPDFTKSDYLNGSEPFAWLAQFGENKFQLAQLMEKMSQRAGEVGVRNFKKLFGIYLQTLRSKEDVIALNTTDFEGQALQLDSGQWVCDEFGVTTTDKFGFEVVACTHPILPVQRLVNIDTGIEKLKIAYRKGRAWREIIMEKRTLASNTSILSMADYGVAVNSENSRHLVRYLTDMEQLNYERIPEWNSVSRLGWISGQGFSPYVEKLVFDGDITYKHFFESVRQRGAFDKWLEVARKVRAGASIPARIMLAAAFASVLVEPCGALPFIVHLWGSTEGGKTVALMLAASVWANPRMGEYIHSFNSTGVAQELSAGFVNSLPLILDELQIIKERKDFDNMIYQLTEGVGRQRGAKTGGLQRVSTWNNCILTSGEMPISSAFSGSGSVNRVIDVEYTDQALFQDPVYVAETIKKHYGFAGKLFVEKLMEEGTMEEVISVQKQFMKELQKSQSTDKQAISASLILAADYFASEWLFQDGNALRVHDIKSYLCTRQEVSQNLRAYEYMMDLIAMNDYRFLPNIKEGTEIWGMLDKDYAYIIKTKFDDMLREGGYSAASFLSWLCKNSLADHEPGRKDKVKKIGGLARRCVWLKLPNEDGTIKDKLEAELVGFWEIKEKTPVFEQVKLG